MTAIEREYKPREHPKTVLLVDDQQTIADAVKEMLSGEEDIVFHYCSDPIMAVRAATELSPTE